MTDTNEEATLARATTLELLAGGEPPWGTDEDEINAVLSQLPDAELLILAAAGWWRPWAHIRDEATLRSAWDGRLPESMVDEFYVGRELLENPHLTGDLYHDILTESGLELNALDRPDIVQARTLHEMVDVSGRLGHGPLSRSQVAGILEHPRTSPATIALLAYRRPWRD